MHSLDYNSSKAGDSLLTIIKQDEQKDEITKKRNREEEDEKIESKAFEWQETEDHQLNMWVHHFDIDDFSGNSLKFDQRRGRRRWKKIKDDKSMEESSKELAADHSHKNISSQKPAQKSKKQLSAIYMSVRVRGK